MLKVLLPLALLAPFPALGTELTLPLTAQGQEPGWRLEVQSDSMALTTQAGADVTVALTETQTDGAATIFVGDGLTARVDPAICRDPMTGMPYPYAVTLRQGDGDLTGCGGAPAALLQGDWTVSGVEGKPTEAPATLRFDGDRIGGNSGCNRIVGTITLTGEGLTLPGLAMTRMACPPPQMRTEAAVSAALAATTRFDIAEDGSLILLSGDRPVLTAQR